MSIQFALAPLFVQVALTFCILLGMSLHRRRAVLDKKVKPKDIALRQQKWPERATQYANCYLNQLELPVLFYVLTLLVLFTRQADMFFVLMSWVFVILRIVQASIHVTVNHVKYRSYAFRAGTVVLCVMWIVFALRIYLL
jgi:hypothetical protein